MQHITRRRYTDDFKAQAILLAESIGPAKAARQLGHVGHRERHAENGGGHLKKIDGVLRQVGQMRYAIVARERARYSVRQLCRTLEVSVSGFNEYLSRLKRPDPDAALRADLHTIHAGSRRTYGRPRMVKASHACAHAVGHKRVARLMDEEGLRGKIKGRFKPRTTASRHTQPVAENLLDL